jgi:hypothetical protein
LIYDKLQNQNLIFIDLKTQTVPFIVYDVRAFGALSAEGQEKYVYAL